MKKTTRVVLSLLLVVTFAVAGCYSKPPGSEPQKPSGESSEQK